MRSTGLRPPGSAGQRMWSTLGMRLMPSTGSMRRTSRKQVSAIAPRTQRKGGKAQTRTVDMACETPSAPSMHLALPALFRGEFLNSATTGVGSVGWAWLTSGCRMLVSGSATEGAYQESRECRPREPIPLRCCASWPRLHQSGTPESRAAESQAQRGFSQSPPDAPAAAKWLQGADPVPQTPPPMRRLQCRGRRFCGGPG